MIEALLLLVATLPPPVVVETTVDVADEELELDAVIAVVVKAIAPSSR